MNWKQKRKADRKQAYSLAELMVTGEVCSSCQQPFTAANGFPAACPSCYDPGCDDLPISNYPLVSSL